MTLNGPTDFLFLLFTCSHDTILIQSLFSVFLFFFNDFTTFRFSGVSAQQQKSLPPQHWPLCEFSVCLSISSPASQSLFSSFEAAMCGIAFIRVYFFLHSGFAFTDLHSFPLLLCPSLLFASQKHPGRFLHPLICSETIISVCSCFLSRFFSSLASFICLSGPLVRRRSSRNFHHSRFLPPTVLLSFILVSCCVALCLLTFRHL